MTPTSIKTGRQLDSQTRMVVVADQDAKLIAPGDSNRVALVASVADNSPLAADTIVAIGPLINGVVTPLTSLTMGHPVCHLSVDKIGSALFAALYAFQRTGGDCPLGITIVRQVQELK